MRRALVLNSETPRGVAAAQLPYLPKGELASLLRHPRISAYVKKCIQRLVLGSRESVGSAPSGPFLFFAANRALAALAHGYAAPRLRRDGQVAR